MCLILHDNKKHEFFHYECPSFFTTLFQMNQDGGGGGVGGGSFTLVTILQTGRLK
jgi:hypothetical protein